MRQKLLLSLNFQSTISDFKIQRLEIIVDFFTLVTLVVTKSV